MSRPRAGRAAREDLRASRWGFDADDALYLLGPLLWLPATIRFGATTLAAIGTMGFLILFVGRLARLRRRMAEPLAPAE